MHGQTDTNGNDNKAALAKCLAASYYGTSIPFWNTLSTIVILYDLFSNRSDG